MSFDQNQFHQFLKAGQTEISNLLLRDFSKLNMTNDELLVYLQLKSYLETGTQSPDVSVIAANLNQDPNEVYSVLHQLISKKFIVHETKSDKTGKQNDSYDLTPILDKLLQVEQSNAEKVAATEAMNDRQTLFQKIEVEFGRPLSPIELQTVGKWLDEDHYEPTMIELALQEAVLNQVWNLKYMDRILQSWEKQHITTPQQVQQQREQHNEYVQPQHPNKQVTGPKIPLFKISEQHRSDE